MSFLFQICGVALHRGPMQPQLLFVKLCRIVRIAEQQAVFDQRDAPWSKLQTGMFFVELMRKNE